MRDSESKAGYGTKLPQGIPQASPVRESPTEQHLHLDWPLPLRISLGRSLVLMGLKRDILVGFASASYSPKAFLWLALSLYLTHQYLSTLSRSLGHSFNSLWVSQFLFLYQVVSHFLLPLTLAQVTDGSKYKHAFYSYLQVCCRLFIFLSCPFRAAYFKKEISFELHHSFTGPFRVSCSKRCIKSNYNTITIPK